VMRRNAILLTCYSFVIGDGDINLFNSQLWYRQNIILVIVPWEKERGKREIGNLRIYWYGCVYCDIPPQIIHRHRHDNVGRQIVTLRAENYYVAANNYSGRRSRRKVQSVIRSLPRNTAMWFQHCSGPKAVICDCDYGRSCQECLRHEIVKFFFITCAHRTKWDIFSREDRSGATAASCFSFSSSWRKKKRKNPAGRSYIIRSP